jgi:hypothetical protein
MLRTQKLGVFNRYLLILTSRIQKDYFVSRIPSMWWSNLSPRDFEDTNINKAKIVRVQIKNDWIFSINHKFREGNDGVDIFAKLRVN